MNGNGNGTSTGNGVNRLYRSADAAMIGGVAAGFGKFFNIDPTLVRLGFVLLTLLSGGAFLLVYLLMWLVVPAEGSASTEIGSIMNENLNEMGAKLRGALGDKGIAAPSGGNGAPNANYNQGQLPQANATTQTRQGIGPMVLILIGVFFLLANIGFFRAIHWGTWWPLLLIGLGVVVLLRRK